MKITRTRTPSALSALAVLASTTLIACGAGGGPGGPNDGGELVSGGTYVGAISSDPGSLDPLTGVSIIQRVMVAYAYESMVYVTPEGNLLPWLATEWTESPTKVTFTLHDDITCADGTPFTAQTAANNINYQADPDNATFNYGSKATENITATAEGNTVTVSSEVNDPFLLVNTGTIEMVCQAGLDNPKTLVDATNGTGMYQLSDAQAGASYIYDKRDDYTWGPDGITSETEGLPDTIELRMIPEDSTAANLLLSGEINSAVINGPDQARLDSAGLDWVGERNPVGMMLFNERADRPTADPLVRQALSVALDREETGDVLSNSAAEESVSLVTKPPLLCVDGGPKWSLPPDGDLDKAAELLDRAGWTVGPDGKRTKDGEPLTIKFIYDAATATHEPAAELVQQTWDKLGITTELVGNDANAWSEQLFQTFDWDTGWIQVAPGSPAVLSSFFAAATPDKGGNNFMFVDNPEYEALVKQARNAGSTEAACEVYQQAEAELIERFDVYPLADNQLKTYLNGSIVQDSTFSRPPMIRMVG